MKIINIILTISIVIVFSGCSISPPVRKVSIPLSLSEGKLDVHLNSIMEQKDIELVFIFKSNPTTILNEPAASGAISAFGIMNDPVTYKQNSKIKEQKIKPIREALSGFDFKLQFHTAIREAIRKIKFINIVNTEQINKNWVTPLTVREYQNRYNNVEIPETQGKYFLEVKSSHQFTLGFQYLTMVTKVILYKTNKQIENAKPQEVYSNLFQYYSPDLRGLGNLDSSKADFQSNSYSETADSDIIDFLLQDNARIAKYYLEEAVDQTAIMIVMDLPDTKVANIHKNNKSLRTYNHSFQIVSEEGDRVILRSTHSYNTGMMISAANGIWKNQSTESK